MKNLEVIITATVENAVKGIMTGIEWTAGKRDPEVERMVSLGVENAIRTAFSLAFTEGMACSEECDLDEIEACEAYEAYINGPATVEEGKTSDER